MCSASVLLIGVDFTSAPCERKPIVAAIGRLAHGDVVVDRIEPLCTFGAFECLLGREGPWVGAFDFPFGFARELVAALRWPGEWSPLIRHYASLDRRAVELSFERFRAARAIGDKYAHRATERAAGAHPSMKLVNPPVGWMLHEGVPRLIAAGVCIPGLDERDCDRVAVEAYPAFVLRPIAGRASYKSDDPRKWTPERERLRARLVAALGEGTNALAVRVRLDRRIRNDAIRDPSGDTLDAIACLAQAGWAAMRADERYGLPPSIDPLEGWIAGAAPAVE